MLMVSLIIFSTGNRIMIKTVQGITGKTMREMSRNEYAEAVRNIRKMINDKKPVTMGNSVMSAETPEFDQAGEERTSPFSKP